MTNLAESFVDTACRDDHKTSFLDRWRQHVTLHHRVLLEIHPHINDSAELVDKWEKNVTDEAAAATCKNVMQALQWLPDALARVPGEVAGLVGEEPQGRIFVIAVPVSGSWLRRVGVMGEQVIVMNAATKWRNRDFFHNTVAHELTHLVLCGRHKDESRTAPVISQRMYREGAAEFVANSLYPQGQGLTYQKRAKLNAHGPEVAAKLQTFFSFISPAEYLRLMREYEAWAWEYHFGHQLFSELAKKHGPHTTLQITSARIL